MPKLQTSNQIHYTKNSANNVHFNIYCRYGKYSVTIQAINKGGAITDVITMSDQGDEIDIEICGKPVAPYTNVFWKYVNGANLSNSNIDPSLTRN